jgi:hypothetical protein
MNWWQPLCADCPSCKCTSVVHPWAKSSWKVKASPCASLVSGQTNNLLFAVLLFLSYFILRRHHHDVCTQPRQTLRSGRAPWPCSSEVVKHVDPKLYRPFFLLRLRIESAFSILGRPYKNAANRSWQDFLYHLGYFRYPPKNLPLGLISI